MALRLNKPLYAVNHLDGHLNSIYLGEDVQVSRDLGALLVLLVSGGHTALIYVQEDGRRTLVGQTLDDAAGEALDKGAKLLGLPYPGGPAIEQAAQGGDGRFVDFPRGGHQLDRPESSAI